MSIETKIDRLSAAIEGLTAQLIKAATGEAAAPVEKAVTAEVAEAAPEKKTRKRTPKAKAKVEEPVAEEKTPEAETETETNPAEVTREDLTRAAIHLSKTHGRDALVTTLADLGVAKIGEIADADVATAYEVVSKAAK